MRHEKMGNKWIDYSIYTVLLTLLAVLALFTVPGLVIGLFTGWMLYLNIQAWRDGRDVYAKCRRSP